MNNRFNITFVASILALIMAGCAMCGQAQAQSAVLSDEDEANILEALVRLETKNLDSEFGSIRSFSTANLSRLSRTRIEELGFRMIEARYIDSRKSEYVIEYLVLRTIQSKDGVVFVTISAVTEGQPCFAPAFSRQRSFTYRLQKEFREWVGHLVKRSGLFSFSRNLITTR